MSAFSAAFSANTGLGFRSLLAVGHRCFINTRPNSRLNIFQDESSD
jgi:hypothetical protein